MPGRGEPCLLVLRYGGDARDQQGAVGGLGLEQGGGESCQSVGGAHIYRSVGGGIGRAVGVLVDGDVRFVEV